VRNDSETWRGARGVHSHPSFEHGCVEGALRVVAARVLLLVIPVQAGIQRFPGCALR
jgi:hypothetical protein